MGRMAYGTRTAMNLGVLPMPYVDTGRARVRRRSGSARGSRLWYGVYGVSGLRGSNDVDWMALRSIPYNDNNAEPAYGGRLTLSYSVGRRARSSATRASAAPTRRGQYDRDATARVRGVGRRRDAPASASSSCAASTPAGSTDLDPTATGYPFALVDPFFAKEGFYAELEHPLGKYLLVVYRYEELQRTGTPLPGRSRRADRGRRFVRYTGGVVLTPAQSLFVKLSWEYWETTRLRRVPDVSRGHRGSILMKILAIAGSALVALLVGRGAGQDKPDPRDNGPGHDRRLRVPRAAAEEVRHLRRRSARSATRSRAP